MHGGHAVALFAGLHKGLRKKGILEIACCEIRNLVPPVAPGEDGDCPMSDNFLSVPEIDPRIAFARENLG
jgi:hypothetical protein